MAPSPAANRAVRVHRLGLVEYVPTWQRQEALMDATLAIKTQNRLGEATGAAPQPTPNHLLLCEHPHTYTLGKSGKPEHLLLDEPALAAHGASFHRINRGGDITYHGPGQLVGYPILDLDNFRPDIHWYLRTLEEAVIRTLAEYGLDAGRIAGLTGVWLGWQEGAPNPRKICALGVKCSRWVTLHGFALNVNPDLSYFRPHRALRHHRQSRDLAGTGIGEQRGGVRNGGAGAPAAPAAGPTRGNAGRRDPELTTGQHRKNLFESVEIR